MAQLPDRLVAIFRPMTGPEVRCQSFGQVKAMRRPGATTWQERRDTIDDPRIFGPEKDDACACGKYQGMMYHRMICDRCGVKISTRSERSRRFGHIELAAPVPHPVACDSDPLTAFPILPASYVGSDRGRQIASIYDSVVLASNAESRDDIVSGLERLAEVLLPVIESAHGWGLADAAVLARGLALEARGDD